MPPPEITPPKWAVFVFGDKKQVCDGIITKDKTQNIIVFRTNVDRIVFYAIDLCMKPCSKEYLLKLFWFAFFGLLSGVHFKTKQQSEPELLFDTVQTIETVSYKTDTLDTSPKAVMYYTKNQIIRNYIDNDDRYQMRLPFFVHENWHRHNYKFKRAKNSNMTPYECFKLCAWDEISANICAALTARFEYFYSSNPDSVSNAYARTCLNFYIAEIQSDKIKPCVENISDEECKLLLDGVVKMWITKYFKLYSKTHEAMVIQHFDKNKFFATKPSRYNELRSKMLYIGGIDFASFLDKDIDLYDKKILVLEQMFGIQILENIWGPVLDKIVENYDSLSQMSENDKRRVLWNIVMSEKLKYMLESMNITDVYNNKNTVQKIYDIITREMLTDYNFNVWVSNFSPFTIQKTNVHEPDYIIKQVYKYNDVYLSDIINTKNNFGPLFYIKRCKKSYFLNKTLLDFVCSKQEKQNKDSVDNIIPLRRSEIQYIDLPNFSGPILRNTTKTQQNEIRRIIKKYEDIPTVLKKCDTNAQKAYLKQHQR